MSQYPTIEYVRIDKRRARELYDDGKTIVMSLDKPPCRMGESVHWSGITTVTKEAAGDTFDKLASDGLQWKHRYPGSQGLVWFTPKEVPVAHRKSELVRPEYESYEKRNDKGEPFPTVITDMIADLLHLGTALAEADPETARDEGWDPEAVLEQAYRHYYAEAVEPDGIELGERAAL